MSTPRYTVTERQIEQLKTIVEKLKIDDLKAGLEQAFGRFKDQQNNKQD